MSMEAVIAMVMKTDQLSHCRDGSFTGALCRLDEERSGDLCSECATLVKNWRKQPRPSKNNWNDVVDSKIHNHRTRITRQMVKKSSSKMKQNMSNAIYDAISIKSSASPVPSTCTKEDMEVCSVSNQDDGYSFLDPAYWKRQKVCCGIIYKGICGEVMIDLKHFNPCYNKTKNGSQGTEGNVNPEDQRTE
uniref:Uncharacterized protein n=1 Tax=Leptobrachium leishanense TaxID=445787 RepID=A0A8C5LR86_9ANUR